MTQQHYTEQTPNPALEHFIKRFWKFNNPSQEELRYTILPDGYFDVIISISPNNKIAVSLYGLWTNALEVIVPALTTVIGISCKPLADEYILIQDISCLLNSNKTLPNQFLGINQTPYENFTDWVAEISNHMTDMLKAGKPIEEKKKQPFKWLFDTNGTLMVAELSTKLFWQPRQMNRYFNEKFGLSLKAYSNILRCFSTSLDIRNGDLFPTADYYDQSHFIKQIKKHTGVKPRELYENKNDRSYASKIQ